MKYFYTYTDIRNNNLIESRNFDDHTEAENYIGELSTEKNIPADEILMEQSITTDFLFDEVHNQIIVMAEHVHADEEIPSENGLKDTILKQVSLSAEILKNAQKLYRMRAQIETKLGG